MSTLALSYKREYYTLIVGFLSNINPSLALGQTLERTKLILQITIDQLRTDLN